MSEARQQAVLRTVAQRAGAIDGGAALVVVGSLARGETDELSDLDLILVCEDHAFPGVWRRRRELSADAVWAGDDAASKESGPGVHKWLTEDLVLVECLITEPTQCRLAEPFVAVHGRPEVIDRMPRRPPISREEMRPDSQAVIRAYDELKHLVRRARL